MQKFVPIFFFIILSATAFAQSNCTTNAVGDVTCPDAKNPNITYTTSSSATLASREHTQTIANQQAVLAQQQQTLNQQALQEVIANQIASDPKLSAQQAAITKSLNAHTK